MLTHTFCHLPGIGLKTERRLWSEGVLTWGDLFEREAGQLDLFPRSRRTRSVLEESFRAFEDLNFDFFAERLPVSQLWRMYRTFPRQVVFLDIETTGLSHYYDEVTMIGWASDGTYSYVLPWHDNSPLLEELSQAAMIVTFNGALFDLKFLRRDFPDARLPKAHIDLRFLARRLKMSGGQKSLEEELGIGRKRQIEGLSGADAVLLWHDYKTGSKKAFRDLVTYNLADVQGLCEMLEILVVDLEEAVGFPPNTSREPACSTPEPPWPREPEFESFQGSPGPRVVLGDLDSCDDLSFVGIDLTGSETRPSGWAVIRDGHVDARLVGSDQELIARSMATAPQLISIDSPLSLPDGRVTPFDDDPTRDEFGIMRGCERELKRRGVNVYPCLLPSMQKLTQRGIRLAAAFRAQGVPVIESYPGAAQDILGIPRKRASLQHLRDGLESFGLLGLGERALSHDELDAVTSALVGLFFWVGWFEGLGTPSEEYLIIPSISGASAWSDKLAIGLSGPIASGKTTAGRFFEAKGYRYARFSLVLQRSLEADGRRVTREALQDLGSETYAGGRQRALEWDLLATVSDCRRVVVDGLRHPEDHAFLVEQFGPRFHHLRVDAHLAECRRRHISQGGDGTQFDMAIAHVAEQSVSGVSSLAHEVLENHDSLEELESLVKRLHERVTRQCR